MSTKVKSYRINITDNPQEGDAIVVGNNGDMISQHLGTVASCDTGTCCGNVPVLDENGKLDLDVLSGVALDKPTYDPNNKQADVYDYCNFDNTPEIPVVNDPVITFTQGGVTMGTISLNQAGATEVALLPGGVIGGDGIDITNNVVSVDGDGTSIGIKNHKAEVIDYSTIKEGAAAGATAVQPNDLATVAMSGKYCDLTGKPEIPSAQIQSDWAQTNTDMVDYIKNKPTIGNATITLQKNGTNVDCFTLNQTADKCLNLTLSKGDVGLGNVDNTSDVDKPVSTAMQSALDCKENTITDLSDIRCNACAGANAASTISCYGDIVTHNICEFATATQGGKADTAVQPGDLCAIATSAKYCDLTGAPNLCSVATTGNYNDLNNKPSLSTVATTGKYCDLIDKPNLCTVATSGKYCDLNGRPAEVTTNDMITGTSTTLGVVSAKGVADYVSCRVSNLYKYKGTVNCYSDLPATGNVTGDTYNVKCAYGDFPKGTNFSWDGTDWDGLGGSIDLSCYAELCDLPTDNCQLGNGCGYTTCTGTLVASDLNPYTKSCDLCTVATSGKYCDLTGTPTIPTDNCQLANGCGYTTCTGTLVASDLNPYAKSCSLSSVATSGKYCDLSGKPSLATVATSGCYNDLTGKPTIPTKVSELSNDCNYIDKEVNNLSCYTPSCSLATVATSGAYCDLTGTPTLACVATSGCYDDLSGKPNLGVYQTTANMVCSLANADDNHYPTAKAVSDAMACAGVGDMLSSVYDPCEKKTNAFDYCNFINTPNLCAVATSGKYCDLTGTPSIPAALTAGCGTTISSNKINVNYDGTTIKNNSGNCLYADYTGLATTAQLDCKADASSLCTVATSGKYCDLTGTPSLCTIATTGCYNDLTGKPTLCTVATSGKYCDLTGIPNLCVVATSGKYCDLTGTPTIPDVNTKTFTLNNSSDTTNATAAVTYINEGGNALVIYNGAVYTLYSKSDSSVVFKSSLNTSGGNTYSTIQQSNLTFTVSSGAVTAITAGNTSLGKYLETDRNYCCPFTPTANGHPATKKYVDDGLSGKQATLTSGENIEIDANNKISANNLFIITESDVTVTKTDEYGVAPYNTSYKYTNIDISANAGIKWVEGAVYTFVIDTTMIVVSGYRNVRVKIGDGAYIPVMSGSSILAGNSYFGKAQIRQYQYSTKYESGGALHLFSDSNTTYSSMTVVEGQTGTATSARSIAAANLKSIIQYHAVPQVTGATSLDRAYISTSSGVQTTYNVSQGASNNAMVRRSGTQIIVPDTPTDSCHAASKKYVDDRAVPTTGTTGYVLTKTANGCCWAAPAETGITNDTVCTTSTLEKIWVGTQAEYESISTYCDTTAYLVF